MAKFLQMKINANLMKFILSLKILIFKIVLFSIGAKLMLWQLFINNLISFCLELIPIFSLCVLMLNLILILIALVINRRMFKNTSLKILATYIKIIITNHFKIIFKMGKIIIKIL